MVWPPPHTRGPPNQSCRHQGVYQNNYNSFECKDCGMSFLGILRNDRISCEIIHHSEMSGGLLDLRGVYPPHLRDRDGAKEMEEVRKSLDAIEKALTIFSEVAINATRT